MNLKRHESQLWYLFRLLTAYHAICQLILGMLRIIRYLTTVLTQADTATHQSLISLALVSK